MIRYRAALRKIHLYFGLTVGIHFALMGMTGSLLVFSEEIDRAWNPTLLTSELRHDRVAFADVEKAVADSFPSDRIYRIKMPRLGDDVYEFWMNESEGRRIYVDQYSGAVLGAREFPEMFRGKLFLLHTTLLAGASGKTVVGVSALTVVLLGISGMLLWWRGLRNVKRGLTVKLRAGWKRTNFDLHNTLGFAGFFLLSVNVVSGVYLIFNAPFEKAVHRVTATVDRPAAPRSSDPGGRATLPLAEIFERSKSVFPLAETTWLYPPAGPTAAYMVRKKLPAEWHPNGKSFVYFDQFSGELLRADDATSLPRATKFIDDLYPMHTGVAGGTLHRSMQAVVGLLPAALLVTGFLIWRMRNRKRQPADRGPSYAGRTLGSR